MAVDDEIEVLLRGFSDDIKNIVRSTLTDDAAKNQLIADMNNFIPDVFLNYAGLHDSAMDYCNLAADNYGSGTVQSVTNLIAYRSAREHNADFSDISHITYAHEPDKTALLNQRLAKITAKKDTLFLGQVDTSKPADNSFDPETIKTILASDEVKKYQSVIMSLSLYNPDVNGNHSISLILSPNKHEAILIDQGGKDVCKASKDQIKQLLADSSYTISYEPENTIMENRCDCAIFAAMINEKVAELGTDGIQSYIDAFSNKEQAEKAAEVDARNQEYKKWTFEAYWELYSQNPVFKKYLEGKGVDPSTISKEDKIALLQTFNNGGTIEVHENLPEEERINDPEWKKEIRKAIAHANNQLSQEFEEYTDEEHPDHIFFRDKNNNRNIIAFASKDNAYVEGEQNAFDELVVAAQKMGKDTITFGKFEEHPEYRAKLYLACLKYGMKMKNAPELESLKGFPEYAEIENLSSGRSNSENNSEGNQSPQKSPEKIAEMRTRFRQIDGEIHTASEQLFQDPSCQALISQLKTAQKNRDKDRAKEIRDQIKSTPQGQQLNQLMEQKSQLFQEAMDNGLMSKDAIERVTNSRGVKYEKNNTEEDTQFANRKSTSIRNRKIKQEILRQALRNRAGSR